MANLLQVKRGLKSNLPTLNEGEPGFATDTGEFWIGDGVTNYRFIPGDQYVQTTSDVVFNSVTVSASADGIDAGSTQIINVADPTNSQDAATKNYVDAVEQSLDIKDSVKAATNGSNIDLTSSSDPNPIDGVTLSDGDRVLLKDQTTASENGIYDAVTAINPTSWVRSDDADEDSEVTSGLFVFVEEGTANSNRGFVLTTNDPITVGTTDLSFTQFSGAGQITAGTGLNKSGNTINHDSASVHESGGAVEINHDNLAGFVSNEHINHSSITISPSGILNGGGDITGNVDLGLDHSDVDHDQTTNFNSNEHIDWTLDQSGSYTFNDANVQKTAVTQYSYTYSDLSLGIDDTPVDAETSQPISSNWAYDHTNATSGVHGAGANSLLHSGSTIDCGSFT